MEPEQLPPEIESKKSVWKEETLFTKYLAMFLFIIMPFIGGAFGYHLAPEKLVEVEKIVTKEVVMEEVVSETNETEATECGFYDMEFGIVPVADDGKAFRDFTIWTPESVEIIQNRSEDREDTTYTIQDNNSRYSATVDLYFTRDEVVMARKMHTQSLQFEPLSKTWWKAPMGGLLPERCFVDNVAYTKRGDPIYVTGDGDVGAFFKSYTVVFEDRLGKKFNTFIPAVIQFKVSANMNDSTFSDYQAFEDVLEQMLLTIEPAVEKG